MAYRGKSKGSYGNQRQNRSIYSVQAARSRRAKLLDSALKAPLAKSDEQWMNDPSHFDWFNIDTPPIVPKTVEVKLEPKVVETIQTEILIQPTIVKTNSISEVVAEGSPSKAKIYAEKAEGFEVLEGDFVNHYVERQKARFNGNIKYFENVIKNIESNPQMTDRKKKNEIEKNRFNIEAQKRMLTRFENGESRPTYEHNAKEEYIQLIKDSIKHGEPVPQEVVQQRPEFQVAQDARRRYEKGLHTSFANKSAAVNAVMFLEKGYKVKRQDGKPILEHQINEIDTGISEIQAATGSSKDIMEKSDLTIAHTSGTYPFLDSAGGLYHPTEKTITMGILGIRALAHEWGHWLDHEAGKEARDGYEIYSNGTSHRKIKAYRQGLSKTEEYSNPLFQNALYSMNNRYAIRELQKAKREKRELPPEQAEMAKTMSARIGAYWRDPREIFARLTEQYVAETLGKPSQASESATYYEKHPAYWNKEHFEELKPIVKAEIERRISIARGS